MHDTLTTPDGTHLHTRRWLSAAPPRALLVFVHGLGEHIGRYERPGRFFADSGIVAAGYDQRGFGRSEGPRAYVDPFDAYLNDLDLFLSHVRVEFPAAPLFLFGHSMGGLIVAAYALERRPRQHNTRGLILSSPALGSRQAPVLQKLAGFLGRVAPRLPTIPLDLRSLSRDPAVLERVLKDPLFYRGRLHARTGANLLSAIRRTRAHAGRLQCPFLLTHGEADQITDPLESRRFFQAAGAKDKTLHVFPGLYHETFNEPEGDEVLAVFRRWLEARL